MDFHNVIEISSSPEPNSPRKTSKMPVFRPRARNTLKRPLGPPEDEVVIELTDSDSEERGASLKKKSKVARKNDAEAGPSRLRPSNPHHPPAFNAEPGSIANKPLARQGTLNPDASLVQPIEKEKLPPIQPPDPQPENNIPQNENQINVARVTPEPQPQTEPIVPPPTADPIDAYVAQVLEIIPDVEPGHLLALIEHYLPTSLDNVVPTVLHLLFEDQTYPKVSQKGKRKRDENEEEAADRGGIRPKVDYLSKDREIEGGDEYIDIAMVSSLSVRR
jgi:TRIAD3 protein (E3 ubiquitin-protein ligase RNF216)